MRTYGAGTASNHFSCDSWHYPAFISGPDFFRVSLTMLAAATEFSPPPPRTHKNTSVRSTSRTTPYKGRSFSARRAPRCLCPTLNRNEESRPLRLQSPDTQTAGLSQMGMTSAMSPKRLS